LVRDVDTGVYTLQPMGAEPPFVPRGGQCGREDGVETSDAGELHIDLQAFYEWSTNEFVEGRSYRSLAPSSAKQVVSTIKRFIEFLGSKSLVRPFARIAFQIDERR
jgi:hypothetical protein